MIVLVNNILKSVLLRIKVREKALIDISHAGVVFVFVFLLLFILLLQTLPLSQLISLLYFP